MYIHRLQYKNIDFDEICTEQNFWKKKIFGRGILWHSVYPYRYPLCWIDKTVLSLHPFCQFIKEGTDMDIHSVWDILIFLKILGDGIHWDWTKHKKVYILFVFITFASVPLCPLVIINTIKLIPFSIEIELCKQYVLLLIEMKIKIEL